MEEPNLLVSLVPLILFTVPASVTAGILAAHKGRPPILWALGSLVPFIGLFVFWYLVGSSNLKAERRLDHIVSLLERQQKSTAA